MSTTIKRITLNLTKEDMRIIDQMCIRYGETKQDVIKRALIMLYYDLKNVEEKESCKG